MQNQLKDIEVQIHLAKATCRRDCEFKHLGLHIKIEQMVIKIGSLARL